MVRSHITIGNDHKNQKFSNKTCKPIAIQNSWNNKFRKGTNFSNKFNIFNTQIIQKKEKKRKPINHKGVKRAKGKKRVAITAISDQYNAHDSELNREGKQKKVSENNKKKARMRLRIWERKERERGPYL